MKIRKVWVLIVIAGLLIGCGSSFLCSIPVVGPALCSASPTPTDTPTATMTATATDTPTSLPTLSATPVPTQVAP